jgi:uncharacterized membrane protein
MIAAHPESHGASTTMDAVVGGILVGGVLASLALISAGMVWHWITSGKPQLEYVLTSSSVVDLLVADFRQVLAGAARPRVLVNLGIAVLMLTPYVRVLASVVYFAAVERNPKYTVFTGVVFAVLTYSLFF